MTALGPDFDAKACKINQIASLGNAPFEDRIAAAIIAGDELVELNREFGRALGEQYAPHLTEAQQDAIYEHVWVNDIGDGFADIEQAYIQMVNFLNTYPTA